MNSLLSMINGFRSRSSSSSVPSPLTPVGSASTSSDSFEHDSVSLRVCKYDVFISFRGTDVRNTFVDHLYNHLIRKGIFTFKDDKQLHKGELISSQLVQAIKNSRVSIVIFSKDYANSSWCLDEMATISQCRQEFNQKVFPVFYDVDPSHVRKQIGVYKNAFVQKRKRFEQDPVDRWRKAMTDLANLAGCDIRNKPECEEIKNIVEAVIKTLGHKFSGFANDLVGIQPLVGELETILKLNSQNDDFRVLGIWGMGGIGKTTYATSLYDRISYQFDAHCFVENVSKIYQGGGAIAIHKQILRQTFDEKNLEAYSAIEVSRIVRDRIHNIRILLILDDVDELEQLEKLAIDPKLLCKGSRMIITTRDEHILKAYGAVTVHQVPLLKDKDACDLFCKKAFKNEDQSSSCVELIPEVLQYAQRLPLAIRVMSSFLCNRDAIQWRDALNRLENNPNSKIVDVLQVTIDSLEHEEKEMFLHIACFFEGERVDYVKRILGSCGLHPHIGIQRIIEKSLITIKNHEIHMHQVLQELGKKIVRHEYLEKPGCWSRLWLYEDFHHVLATKSGTNNVEAIVLNPKEGVSRCSAGGLSKMENLKLLILHHINFMGNLDFLPNSLKYLLWHGCPFASLPPDFEPCFLVELNMPDSCIRQLWKDCKELPSLKRMDLSNSKNLIETPNFSRTPKLERLDLSECTNLLKVHSSIGLLTKLTFLSLRNCTSLVRVDFGPASELRSLRVLYLSGCTKLESTPDFTGASYLEYLDIDGCTSFNTVHESIGALEKLRVLSFRDCANLSQMPNNINTMTSLITLDFRGCLKLTNLPLRQALVPSSGLKSLIFLDLGFCNLSELPNAIVELSCIERLNLQGNNFLDVPPSLNLLRCLAYLNLAHCRNLQHFPYIPGCLEKASSAGRYFKTTTGSRDHRSGLYVFDCPKFNNADDNESARYRLVKWLERMLKDPRHYRCGFDIIVPSNLIAADKSLTIPKWFDHRFKGDSIIRIVPSDLSSDWIGFSFCVAFEVSKLLINPLSLNHSSSSTLWRPFYLSFESEYAEERFDVPLNLELAVLSSSSKYHWIIYISSQHCHFVKTGAHITFKAHPGLMIKEWGLRMVKKHDITDVYRSWNPKFRYSDYLVIDNVQKNSNSSWHKIQLPYNWLVTEEDEVENSEAKAKENNLTNLGYT